MVFTSGDAEEATYSACEGWKARRQQALRWVMHTVFGSFCWSCHVSLSWEVQGLCASCWARIHFLKQDVCQFCGEPVHVTYSVILYEEELVCAHCRMQPYLFSWHRSAVIYTPATTGMLIQKFKHAHHMWLAPLFARWMLSVIPLPDPCSVLMPVPLHWTRLLSRRMNQSMVLALELRPWNIPLSCGLLRAKRTASQGHKNLSERQKNVHSSFALSQQGVQDIKGKTVILVDDVFTTGSTLNACAAVLWDNGAQDVRAVTLAKVVQTPTVTLWSQ